ncbi:N-acetylmuramoyl-L-alanine amidase [Streptomyces sp. NPDC053048]|uniref:peptidoglycan recognition protein family protein n=1 Tax=Streptomyces sp. NPDC053048 TaxID=3365694 RepID=UPI0037CE06A2
MRGILVSSALAACAALTLPFLATPSGATAPDTTPRPAPSAARPAVPGSTHSLPLVPSRHRAVRGGGAERVLPPQDVPPFSMVGIVWDDATAELRGTAQVRTRPVGAKQWSGWQDVETHDDDRPDLDSPETRGGSLRGSTAPLWVGACDAVQVRVRQDPAAGRTPDARPLPSGLRVELVDPGKDPRTPRTGRRAAPGSSERAAPAPSEEETAASAANVPLAPLGATEIPAMGKPESAKDVAATHVDLASASTAAAGKRTDPDGHGEGDPEGDTPDAPPAPPAPPLPPVPPVPPAPTADPSDPPEEESDELAGYYVGPRPRIVTRAGWGADESIRERGFPYTKTVRAAFVHHTASGNGYSCSQSASVIRGIYRYHVVSSGWRDLGYNFLVDKCGTVYEGRAGGVAKPVRGAHTLGFNTNSMGIAVLGSFGRTNPSEAAVDAVATLTAWKLGLYDVNPAGRTTLVSGGGNLFKKGTSVKLKVISGHRDGYATECPGDRLYNRLGAARAEAARLQGR